MIIIRFMPLIIRFALAWMVLLTPAWQPILLARLPAARQPVGWHTRYHPDGGLQVGDLVSIQVVPPAGFHADGMKLKISLPGQQVTQVEVGFDTDGMGMLSATLLWGWDTNGLNPGSYRIGFEITPSGEQWEENVSLAAAPPGPKAVWVEKETECCRLHVISGTAAARDLEQLAREVDARAALVRRSLGSPPQKSAPAKNRKLEVNLVPRVLGQGGFTAEEVLVSYDDRLYSHIDVTRVVQHELVHRVDGDLGGDFQPLLLAEGMAVYLTGGHYKQEPVLLRAAHLLKSGEYLPLPQLAEDFYSHQHETSYLEAAALLDFMVRSWGWEAVNRFYRDIHLLENQKAGEALGTALLTHFNLTVEQLDDRFISFLEKQPVLPDLREDLEITTAYFDAIREYQQKLDPAAYFLQVWLPDPAEMRRRGIVADYLRSPHAPANLVMEGLLYQVGEAWRAGRSADAWRGLAAVRQALAALGP